MTTLHKYLGSKAINTNDFLTSDILEVWQRCDNCNAQEKGYYFMSYRGKHYCLNCAKIKQEEQSEMDRLKVLREQKIAEYEKKGLNHEDAIFLANRDNPKKKDRRGGLHHQPNSDFMKRLKLVSKLMSANGIPRKEAWKTAFKDYKAKKEVTNNDHA